MKSKVVLALALVSLCVSSNAETRAFKWMRRAAAAASCGLSLWDAQMSAKYLDGKHNLYEANRWLRNPDGTINLGRMAGVKAGVCLAPVVLGEMHFTPFKWTEVVAGGAGIGVFGGTVAHNYKLVHQQSH